MSSYDIIILCSAVGHDIGDELAVTAVVAGTER